MRYTIVTPTLIRPSLAALCDSLDTQVCDDWEHLIVLDSPPDPAAWAILTGLRKDPRRRILHYPGPQGSWGVPLRHAVWSEARGDYLLYTDDDCYFADPRVLEDLREVTTPWAVFQLLYRGKPEPVLPLRVGRSDLCSIMVSRELGPLPDYKMHEGDGIYIDKLAREHPGFAIVDARPMLIYRHQQELP